MQCSAKHVLIDGKWQNNKTVVWENGRIIQIENLQGNPQAEYLTPGMLDVHCHGGNGFGIREGATEDIELFLDAQLNSGVTDILMGISTDTKEKTRKALEETKQAIKAQMEGKLGGARIVGVHLEGPFLSSARPGAMLPGAIQKPDVTVYRSFVEGYEEIICEMSLAPEEEGADELIAYLLSQGVCAQAGHTYATYEQAMHGFDQGIRSLCHSFNACRPILHRDPGVVTAAMERPDVYMEAICDLVHLHPGTIKLIYREKGPHRMIVISDSVKTHGMPDGEYMLGGGPAVVKNGVTRTLSGALDGGGVYLDGAVRNLISIGIPEADALTMTSQTPNERLGFTDRGKIAPGCVAHLTAWDANFHVIFTVLEDGVHVVK